jgi:hypothetical protein
MLERVAMLANRSVIHGILVCAAALALGACASQDRHVFESVHHERMSIQLVDASTGEELWRMPVPPGYKLVIDLDRKGESEVFRVSGRPATSMRWRLYDQDRPNAALEDGRINLPGVPVVLKRY